MFTGSITHNSKRKFLAEKLFPVVKNRFGALFVVLKWLCLYLVAFGGTYVGISRPRGAESGFLEKVDLVEPMARSRLKHNEGFFYLGENIWKRFLIENCVNQTRSPILIKIRLPEYLVAKTFC